MTLERIEGKTASSSPAEVLLIFLKLGLTCFGGPIAHIGYFRDEFVVRRKWIDEHAYADLVGLCQFLPGPASSQVGFSIGLMWAGYLGALVAWTGKLYLTERLLSRMRERLRAVSCCTPDVACWLQLRRPGSCVHRGHSPSAACTSWREISSIRSSWSQHVPSLLTMCRAR